MNFIDQIKIYGHMVKFLATRKKYNLKYCPKSLDPDKFIPAASVPNLIENGSVIASAGMAGHARCSIFFWAIKEAFEKNKTPSDLTWITGGAQGGRGKLPGTIEELDSPGIISEYICGHVETAKSLLRLGDKGQINLHVLPQGKVAQLLKAQGSGQYEIETSVGRGTFFDPAVKGTTAVTAHTQNNYVKKRGDNLVYSLPPVDTALFVASYADAEGNIYFKDMVTITEILEVTHAAKFNKGKVIATVSSIIEKDPSSISLPAHMVNHIVVNPASEQTTSIPQKKFWPMFTEGGSADPDMALAKLKKINAITKLAPSRDAVDDAMSRMAASLFVNLSHKGALVNLGTGMPEEVGRLLYKSGLFKDFTLSSETGVYGGIPTPGLFFGGAINPEKMYTSSQIFDRYKTHLDTTVLGTLQVDGSGNVNVSKRGERVLDYVGPGGFMDIVDSAKNIIFIGSWMARADFSLENGKLSLNNPGIPKFVNEMLEVTFNAKQALDQGKMVYYVTTVGVFELTRNGLLLIQVMPGIDIERDIRGTCNIPIQVSDILETVPREVVTGENYQLTWRQTEYKKAG